MAAGAAGPPTCGAATLADRLLMAGGGYPAGGSFTDNPGTLGQGGNSILDGSGGADAAGGGGSSYVLPAGSSGSTYANATRTGNGLVTITPSLTYAAPMLDGTNISNVPGTWDVNGTKLYYNDGNVGIGTTDPRQKLDVNGTVLVRDAYDLLLRDANVGLGWYGSTDGGKVFTAATGFDGPVLYGYSGGMLGTKDGGNRAALTWKNSGRVGIGTPDPQAPLQVNSIGLFGGGALPATTNATGIGWNAVNPGIGESELYNYRGLGSGGFRFFSVGGSGAPAAGNQIAFINTAGVYQALSDPG